MMPDLFAHLRTIVRRKNAADESKAMEPREPDAIMADMFRLREAAAPTWQQGQTVAEQNVGNLTAVRVHRPASPHGRAAAASRSPAGPGQAASLTGHRDQSPDSPLSADPSPAVIPHHWRVVRAEDVCDDPSASEAGNSSAMNTLSRGATSSGGSPSGGWPTDADGSLLLERPAGNEVRSGGDVVGEAVPANELSWRRTAGEAIDLRRMVEQSRAEQGVPAPAGGSSASPKPADESPASPNPNISSRASAPPRASTIPHPETQRQASPDSESTGTTTEQEANPVARPGQTSSEQEALRAKLRAELMSIVKAWPHLSPNVRDAVLTVVRYGISGERTTSYV